MNIVYLCQCFPPEISAPSARGSEMAQVWQAEGHTVKVVTAFPNHPRGVVPEGYRDKRFMIEQMDGLTVFRSYVYVTPNEGFFKRVLNHLSFTVSAVVQTLPRLGAADVIVASSPSFFPVLAAWVISRVKGIPFVFEVRDLWPGIFKMLGILRDGPVLRALEALEMFLYGQAAQVVTVTHAFKDVLVARGVPAEKISVITNGVDLAQFQPGPPETAQRTAWGLEGRFVVLYLGTHGISQGLETHLEAAHLLADDPDIAFVFIGDGARKSALQAQAAAMGLGNVHFFDAVPKSQVPACYRSADVCLVPLRKIPLFAHFIPSKIFEILGCGRPVLASLEGEARAILEQSEAARVVPPEDAEALAAAIRAVKADPARETKALHGRELVAARFERRALAKSYLGLFERLVAARRRAPFAPVPSALQVTPE